MRDARTKLTPRQICVMRLILREVNTLGRPPTLREIGEVMGIGSTNGVSEHLGRLERKRCLCRTAMASRGIQLIGLPVFVPGAEGAPAELAGWAPPPGWMVRGECPAGGQDAEQDEAVPRPIGGAAAGHEELQAAGGRGDAARTGEDGRPAPGEADAAAGPAGAR